MFPNQSLVVKFDYGVDTNDISCPILEFQLANKRYYECGAEIIDAELSCMAINTDRGGTKIRNSFETNSTRISIMRSSKRDQNSRTVKELNCSYNNIKIAPSKNPFFKRLWSAKHVLDADSPLLHKWARNAVAENNGYWPVELNNYQGIQRAIKFDHLVVNIKGTSNISAADVFAQKIYDSIALFIGYEFVNIVGTRENSKSKEIILDLDMINDVTEQQCGGGKPLFDSEKSPTRTEAIDN